MTENTSFSDLPRVMYRGSEGLDILSGLKIMGYNLRKWPEMAENTSKRPDLSLPQLQLPVYFGAAQEHTEN